MTFGLPRNVCLLLVLIGVLSANEASARKWTDVTGKFSVEADFVELTAGQVTLKRSDGGLIRLPLARLSGADQQHVRSLTAPPAAPQSQSPASDQRTTAPPGEAPHQGATPPSGDNARQTVIAEGVGTSADEALRDAFREAVSQVVGAVVDAETLVKNDQLIEDKILTYSNGFVKTYERISERDQGGLIRVKIRATVERRSLVAKLQAENVTVKNVDGQSLFAEAITKVDEEKGAEALLRKAFEGFPGNCLKAEVVGTPEIVSKDGQKATIRLNVRFSADPEACKAFGARFQPILEKIARDRGSFYLAARQTESVTCTRSGEAGGRTICFFEETGRPLSAMMPKVFIPDTANEMRQKGQFVVGVNVRMSKLGDRTEWSYYCLDEVLKRSFLDVAVRQAQCRTSLLDSDGEEVATDVFRPDAECDFQITMVGTFFRARFCRSDEFFMYPECNPVLVAPFFFRNSDWSYAPVVTIKRNLQITLDELKSVTSIKSMLEFSEPPPK